MLSTHQPILCTQIKIPICRNGMLSFRSSNMHIFIPFHQHSACKFAHTHTQNMSCLRRRIHIPPHARSGAHQMWYALQATDRAHLGANLWFIEFIIKMRECVWWCMCVVLRRQRRYREARIKHCTSCVCRHHANKWIVKWITFVITTCKHTWEQWSWMQHKIHTRA